MGLVVALKVRKLASIEVFWHALRNLILLVDFEA